jgi:transposase
VKEEVLNKIKDIKSFKQVSKELKISISSVLRIFDSIVITSKKLDTSVLYMDEFKGNADGEKYQLAIYDRNKKLVTILKNRKSNTIREFFFTLDVKPRIVVTDLFMQFRNIIRSSLGDVEIVADKYHFVRQVEWMIRDLRTRMYNSDIKFKELKKYWKLLATSPSKLSDKQLDVLARLKKLDSRIENCYGYKEHFYRIMEIDKISEFRSEFEAFIEKLESSEIKESLYLGSTFRNWQKEIENSVKYGINNGFVEGNNNKIKVIKRVSYGIKKFKTLEKLIQLRIS